MLDLDFSWSVLFIAIISCIFPFLPAFIDPLMVMTSVRAIEGIQALMLFGLFIFTLVYMRPWEMANGKKQFWFWAACWWLMLFGRSTSWGRDYFPDVPKIYFRGISVVLIGVVVFMLFSPHLRKEISRKFKTLSLPVWALGLAVFGLIVSDAVEHSRAIHTWFITDLRYQDLIEELYEFPLIFGLFLTAWSFMQRDKLLAHAKKIEQPISAQTNLRN